MNEADPFEDPEQIQEILREMQAEAQINPTPVGIWRSERHRCVEAYVEGHALNINHLIPMAMAALTYSEQKEPITLKTFALRRIRLNQLYEISAV
jgi:hypothetical protein